MLIGFSTGAVCPGNAVKALAEIITTRVFGDNWFEHEFAVELSALREDELLPLLNELTGKKYIANTFDRISVHAPSRLNKMSEASLVGQLLRCVDRGWAVIVHPDIITDFSVWRRLEEWLVIENMDNRKQTGRTTGQLEKIFEQLPSARFCLDLGHAMQVDPTLNEAKKMAETFGWRWTHLHFSFVDSHGSHHKLTPHIAGALWTVLPWMHEKTQITLETPVTRDEMYGQLLLVKEAVDAWEEQRHLRCEQ